LLVGCRPCRPHRTPAASRNTICPRHAFAIAHDDYGAALDHLRAHGVEITFEEDRQGGVLNGPRAYFHDPDGTVLEFIDLTAMPALRNDPFTAR
jgi:catechol 2,3-dioxygenase-like lactoylglutathione lyase family enzyme